MRANDARTDALKRRELPVDRDSNDESKRWRVEWGESCAQRLHTQMNRFMSRFCGICRPTRTQSRGEDAPLAHLDQAHQHKHFYSFSPLVRIRDEISDAWGIPYRCFNASVFRVNSTPAQAFGLRFACQNTRWHRPTGARFFVKGGGVWTKLQTNQPLTAQR